MSRTTASDRPRWRAGAGDVAVGPAEAVAAERVDLLVLRQGAFGGGRHRVQLPPGRVAVLGTGTCVVQTPSPWAMVASRWTYVPSTRSNARVSASHSCGNSAATCATGQWCWQIWTPAAALLRGRSVAVGGQRRRPARRRGWRRVAASVDAARAARRRASSARCSANATTACLAAGLAQVAQRGGGEVVVGVRERGAAGVGERVDAGRAAAAALGRRARVALGEQAVGDQRVEVAADGGGRDAQPLGEGGGGLRAPLEDQPGDGVAGAIVGPANFTTPV